MLKWFRDGYLIREKWYTDSTEVSEMDGVRWNVEYAELIPSSSDRGQSRYCQPIGLSA